MLGQLLFSFIAFCCFQIDSYGGSLRYKVRYTLARGMSEVLEGPDVIVVGNGRRLAYRRGGPTLARLVNQKEIKFTEVGRRWSKASANASLRLCKAKLEDVCQPGSAASRIIGSIQTGAL